MVAVAFLLTVCQLLADDLLLLWNNYRRVVLLALLGVVVALTGAMGVETLGYKLLLGHTDSLWYKFEVAVEEFMEMVGGSLVLVSALKLRLHKGGVSAKEAKGTNRTTPGSRLSPDCA